MMWEPALRYVRFWLVLVSVSGELTDEQKDQIVSLHNSYRSMIRPEAADMQRMVWNDTLAVVAQFYASKCIWEHNREVMDMLGENLFLTTGPLDVNVSIAKWFDEHKNYDYANNTCIEGMCGHYTQVVWAKSNSVGCGVHFCETVQPLDYKNASILVCNYDPPGNIDGEKPYEEGEPCSKCPINTACIQSICSKIESSTEESRADSWTTDTWTTDTWTTDVSRSSAGLKKLSVASLLAGLTVSFIF